MKQATEILVHSSTPGIYYTIAIMQHGEKVVLKCSCPAGEKGLLCKHVIAAVAKDDSILADKQSAWKEWQSILARSELSAFAHDFLRETAAIEKKIKALQKKAKDIKQDFAEVALGQ